MLQRLEWRRDQRVPAVAGLNLRNAVKIFSQGGKLLVQVLLLLHLLREGRRIEGEARASGRLCTGRLAAYLASPGDGARWLPPAEVVTR